MGYPKSTARSEAAWALARRQHGVVSHADLRRIGFSAQSIKHRIASGRLHRVYRGVYAVGRPQLTREGRWMAAVLACGDDATLSHRLLDPEALRQWLELHPGEPGAKRLRALLDRHTFRLSDSALESRFRKLAASIGLPPAADEAVGRWIRGRLLLAGSQPGRGDRRAAISPDPGVSSARSPPRPIPHRRRQNDVALHALSSGARTSAHWRATGKDGTVRAQP